MKTNFFNPLTLLLFTVLLFSSCNKDDLNVPEEIKSANSIEQKRMQTEMKTQKYHVIII